MTTTTLSTRSAKNICDACDKRTSNGHNARVSLVSSLVCLCASCTKDLASDDVHARLRVKRSVRLAYVQRMAILEATREAFTYAHSGFVGTMTGFGPGLTLGDIREYVKSDAPVSLPQIRNVVEGAGYVVRTTARTGKTPIVCQR